MASRRALRVAIHEGSETSDAVLREAWELRLELLTLTRSRDDDWALFRSFVRGSDRCLFCFSDDQGRIQGFFSIAFLPFEQGRRALLMFSKYFYFRSAFRGHYKTMLAPWRLLPMAIRRYGPRSLHFVTTAFPQSYVSLSRTAGRVYTLREQSTPPWQRQALETFARVFYGADFDASTGLVGGANVADSPSLPRSVEARRLYTRYEELNPRWQEGFSLPILFSVDHRLVFHNMRRIGRRLIRR